VLTVGDGRRCLDGPVEVCSVSDRYFPVIDRLVPGAGACCRVAIAAARLAMRHRLDVFEFPNWNGHRAAFPYVCGALPVVGRLPTSALESHAIDGGCRDRVARWEVIREHRLCRTADALVTHSGAHRSAMAAELGIRADDIALVPHGIPVRP